MSAQYRCMVIEVDPEFFRIELDALSLHLEEMVLVPIAVFDPAISIYCPTCHRAYYFSERHACSAARLTG